MNDQAIFPVMQRARGVARVALLARANGGGGGVRLGDLFQQGSAKAMLPQVSGAPEVVFLNTAGGLTGGDRLTYQLSLGEGVAATATTQTAERAYRSASGAAHQVVRLDVGAGAHLDWLPQETILFQDAHLHRHTDIRLHGAAHGCMALESVVLGRAAMGEVVTRLAFADRREIWQGERLVFADPVRLDGADLGPDAAGLAGARAYASLVMLGPGVHDALAPLRALLDEPGVHAAASALPGRLVLRALAADAWPLRRLLARALTHLRRQPLPRVWQM